MSFPQYSMFENYIVLADRCVRKMVNLSKQCQSGVGEFVHFIFNNNLVEIVDVSCVVFC
jgi:hypothetical protein